LDNNEALPDVSEYEKLLELRDKNPDKLTKKEQALLLEFSSLSDDELREKISIGHDYRFVGKVGNFCPIKAGCGGRELVRLGQDKKGNPKYSAATGSKGFRWLEAEMVKTLGKEGDIDLTYHNKLVDDAVDAISQYGDFEQFVSDEPWPELPFVN